MLLQKATVVYSLVLDKFASKHHNVHMVTPMWEVHLATEMTESTFEQPIEF